MIVLDGEEDEEEWKPQSSRKADTKRNKKQGPPLKRRRLSLKLKKHKCDLCDFVSLAAPGLASHKRSKHGIQGKSRTQSRRVVTT